MALLTSFPKTDGLQRARLACCLGLCIVASGMSMKMQSQEIEEYQLKAAFLFNFTKFISWPQADASSKLTVCVVSAKERSEEHTSELQSQSNLVCRLLL